MRKSHQRIIRMLVILGFVQLSFLMKAQVVPNIDWVQHYVFRDSVDNNSSAIDADNNVYVTGYGFNSFDKDLIVLKYDSLGNLLWSDVYDNGGNDEGVGIKVDASGNVYVAATSYDGTSGLDIVTRVYDASGSLLMHDRYDAGSNATDVAADIEINKINGDFWVIGSSFISFDFNVTVLKYKTGFSLDWSNNYNSGNDDTGVGLSLTSNNDAYCTARMYNGSDADVWTFMVDQAGSKYGWDNYVAISGGDDEPQEIITTGSDAVICGKIWDGANSTWDAFTRRIDGSGSTVWHRDYDSVDVMNFHTSLIRDSIGNIGVTGLALGASGWEYHTLMYDSTGVFLWPQVNKEQTNLWGALVEPRISVDTVAHHFYVSGSKQNSNSDVMVYQITPFSGNTKWKQYYNGPLNGADYGTGITVSGLGIVYLSANCENSVPGFNQTTIRLSQTPVYFPLDTNNVNIPSGSNCLFYPNTGEVLDSSSSPANNVLYYTKNTYPQFFFLNNSLSFLTRQIDSTTGADSTGRIDLTFYKGNTLTQHHNFEVQDTGYLNYFKPDFGIDGKVNVKGSKRLMIPNIYHLIDLHYYSNKDGLKMYFVVKPGGDPGSIQLDFTGNIVTSINGSNELIISSSLGGFGFKKPLMYNVTSSVTTSNISGSIYAYSTNKFKFTVGSYTTALPLIIEIEQLQNGASMPGCDWSTFYGGSGIENATKVITDATGASFLSGQTDSPNFPNLVGGYLTTTNGLDGFIVKLSPAGGQVWGTFYGGNATLGNINCYPTSIAKGPSGDIYMTGYTDNATLPLVPTGNTSLQGSGDAFLARFNSAGNSLLFARYFGGAGGERANDIAISSSGDVYIVGYVQSSSTSFPLTTLSGAYNQTGFTGADGFIAKFNSSNTLTWCSFFGGNDLDEIQSIKINSNGQIFMSGYTYSTVKASSNTSNPVCGVPLSANDFPDCTPSGAYTQAFAMGQGGLSDAFITEFNPNGSLAWSTYFGNGANEVSSKIVLNPTNPNEVYLIGQSGTPLGAVTGGPAGSYVQNYNPSGSYPRGFVLKFNNRWTSWITLIGEGTASILNDGVCDNFGNLYVAGRTQTGGYTTPLCQPVALANIATQSPKCFPTSIFNQPVYGGGTQGDAFIMAFDYTNKLTWSTFYGAGSTDDGISLAFDNAGTKLCFFGNTQSGAGGFPLWDPANGNYQQNSNAGSWTSSSNPTANKDCFYAKLCMTAIPSSVKEMPNKGLINDIMLYPNPNNGEFTVKFANFKNTECGYEIYDLTGRIVEKGNKNISQNELGFDLTMKNYKKGIYLLKISTSEKTTNIKFVIE